MQKSQILERLSDAGSNDPMQDYLSNFKGVHYTRHEAVLLELTRSYAEGVEVRNSVKETTVTENTKTQPCNADDFSCEFNLSLWKDGNPRSLTVTPCNWDGESTTRVRDRVNVMSALNAAVDFFYFREFSPYVWMEVGLHLKYSPEEIADLLSVENAGIVTAQLPDDAHGLLIAKSKFHAVGEVNYSFGKWVTTKVDYANDAMSNHDSKLNRTARKHGFADLLLKGRRIVIDLSSTRRIRSWAKIVAKTLQEEDKEQAWKDYRGRKSTAGQEEDTVIQGEKIIQRQLDGDIDEARKSTIKIEVGGKLGEYTLDDIDETWLIQVENRNGGEEGYATYNGSARTVKKFVKWIAAGCTFVVNN